MEDKQIKKPKSPSISHANKSFSTSQNAKPMTDFDKSANMSSEVTSVEKVTQTTVSPRNLKRFFTILISVVLTLLVGVAFVLIVINPRPSRPNDISLTFNSKSMYYINGELVEFDGGVNPIGENLNSNRKVMPGDKIDYSFEISTSRNAETEDVNLNVFLRVKAYVEIESNFYSNVVSLAFTNDDQWYKGGDGYYYLQKSDFDDGLLSPDEKIRIIRHMEIDKATGNEFAGKPIEVGFTAEVLQAEYQAIEEIWPTAPYEWAAQFKYLTW